MTIENTATDHTADDRAFREEWMRTLLAQPKGTVSQGEKIVGTALAWRMNMDTNNPWHLAAWPKAGTLSAEVGMTEGSTTNVLKSLWEKGWLKRIGRSDNGRGSWVYRFIYPEGVTPFGVHRTVESTPQWSQTPADNGVHSPMESTNEWSQTPADNGVRPHSPMESDSTNGLTEYMNESMNESKNQILEETGEDIDSKIEQFRDAYPKRAVLHILEKPFKEAVTRQGATPDQLILAAKNYAAECESANKAMGYITFPTKFLNEGAWENYLTTPRTRTSEPSLDEILSWGVSSEYDYSHMPEDERPF